MGRTRLGSKTTVGALPPVELAPRLHMRQVPHRPMAARFTVSGPGLGSEEFKWSVRRAPRRRRTAAQLRLEREIAFANPFLATPGRSATIDFTHRVDPRSATTSFVVSVSGGGLSAPLTRTVEAHSTYFALKSLGTLRPPMEILGAPEADPFGRALRLRVRNHEDEAIHFTSRCVELLDLDGDSPGPQAAEAIDLELAPRGELELLGRVDATAGAVGIHLSGTSASGLLARTSVYTELPETPVHRFPDIVRVPIWDDPRLWREIDGIRIVDADTLWEAEQEHGVQSAVAEPEGHTLRHGHLPPAPGLVCEAGTPDTEDGLSCVATGETVTQEVPGRIFNARRGDVVLFPGMDGQPIADMAAELTPPQRFAHCGIVTADHAEIRHCTASAEWLMARIDQFTFGLDEDDMRFVWPGAITMTIDQLHDGVSLDAPGLFDYTIGPWTLETGSLIEPLVVRPPAEAEATDPAIRARLIAAANSALSTEAHYRWFLHTSATLPAGSPMPPEGHWAEGTVAAMCSVFVWMAARAAGIVLEGAVNEDTDPALASEPSAVDGLYTYREDERIAAGEILHGQILGFDPGLDPGITAAALDNVANQFCNAFAADDPSMGTAMGDAQPWRAPGEGVTVFPDDIRLWDGPASGGSYGSAEPVVFRPRRLEAVPEHKWARTDGHGSIDCRVELDGVAVEAAEVYLGPEFRGHTGADGHFVIKDVASDADGELRSVWARKRVDKRELATAKPDALVRVHIDQTTPVTLALVPPPVTSRAVDVSGSIDIDGHVDELVGRTLRANAINAAVSEWDAGDTYPVVIPPIIENVDVDVRVRIPPPDAAGQVTVEVKTTWIYYGRPGGGTNTGSFTVPAEATRTRTLAFATDRHDIAVTLTVVNRQADN